MRKASFLLLLFCCLLLLGGCTEFDQVEELAFAEVLGLDITEDDLIEASLQIPKIAGQRGEDGSSSTSSQLVYSAAGKTLDEALHLLQWAVPRRLDLSQLELIVVSETLAKSERFLKTADTIMATPRLYTAARLAVCSGSAREFISAEKPVIGTRTSTELTAAFADYARNGFIPDETFSDVFYRTRSIYSDALAIHADTASQSESQPASAMMPSNADADHIETQNSNRLLGAAILRKGLMIGKLSAEEYLYCKLLRGERQTFPFSAEEKTVGLTTLGAPTIVIDRTTEPMQIDVTLHLSIVSSSNAAAIEPIQTALEEKLTNVIHTCQQMGAEPFGFADTAAASFLAIHDWTEFDWLDRFKGSQINVSVQIHNAQT